MYSVALTEKATTRRPVVFPKASRTETAQEACAIPPFASEVAWSSKTASAAAPGCRERSTDGGGSIGRGEEGDEGEEEEGEGEGEEQFVTVTVKSAATPPSLATVAVRYPVCVRAWKLPQVAAAVEAVFIGGGGGGGEEAREEDEEASFAAVVVVVVASSAVVVFAAVSVSGFAIAFVVVPAPAHTLADLTVPFATFVTTLKLLAFTLRVTSDADVEGSGSPSHRGPVPPRLNACVAPGCPPPHLPTRYRGLIPCATLAASEALRSLIWLLRQDPATDEQAPGWDRKAEKEVPTLSQSRPSSDTSDLSTTSHSDVFCVRIWVRDVASGGCGIRRTEPPRSGGTA